MEREAIKEYILDFQKRELPELVKRELKISNSKKIISIIGPRRAGKTYFLFQQMKELIKNGIKKEQILYLNFEDPKLISVNFEEFKEMIKLNWEIFPESQKDIYLFIDEPQNIEKWEIAVRGLYDEGFKIFLTGSSSKLLSKEIATSLRGRTLSYLLLPFSFREFLNLKGNEFDLTKLGSKEKSELLSLLREYFEFGGFPDILLEEDKTNKSKLISEYFNLIIYRDIIERYKIKNSKLVKWLLSSLISSFSKEISIHKIFLSLKSQGIKASKNTLYSYLSLIEDVSAIFLLKKFNWSIRKSELSLNKIYLSDNSLSKIVETSDNIGKKMENSTFLYLITDKDPLEEIFYWKNTQQEEVDFVIKEGKKIKQLIQVCYDITNLDTKKREINSLIKASKELKCNNLLVLSFDKEGEEEVEWFGVKRKIQFIPLWKFLLS